MNRDYVRPVPADWWLRKRTYFVFMVRELTSVAVAAYAVFLLVLVAMAAQAASFMIFFEKLKTPLNAALSLGLLGLVTFHTVTWINLMPRSIVIWRGEEPIPPRLVAAGGFAAWIGASALVAALVLM